MSVEKSDFVLAGEARFNVLLAFISAINATLPDDQKPLDATAINSIKIRQNEILVKERAPGLGLRGYVRRNIWMTPAASDVTE